MMEREVSAFPHGPQAQQIGCLLARGLRLRCPCCGVGTLFRGWLRMHERCLVCGLRFEREQGYFLGAMYINYGITVIFAVSGYFILAWWTDISLTYQLLLWGSVTLFLPIILFRYARGLWLSVDYFFDPRTAPRPEQHEDGLP